LLKYGNGPASCFELVVFECHGKLESSIHRIVAEKVFQVGGFHDIVHGNEVDFGVVHETAEKQSPDPAHPINGYSHRFLTLKQAQI
jgi:hypothetical protein